MRRVPSNDETVVYPAFDCHFDLGFARIAGAGLGNCFYDYFHAVVLAERCQARVVAPPWFSFKFGPLLRGESSRRFYWRMFRPFGSDIRGLYKYVTLLRGLRRRSIVKIGGSVQPDLVMGSLNLVACEKRTFRGLHSHRSAIRQRLLGIVNDPIPEGHTWGRAKYIAIHVRLGDFAKANDYSTLRSGSDNLRIPLSWYVVVAKSLRKQYGHLPILVFSDGKPDELRELLQVDAQLYRSGSDITDMLKMSAASIFVGSNSTFSRWAAFLGNMPSIWLSSVRAEREPLEERPSDPDTPILFVPIDATEVDLWASLRDEG